MIEVRRHFFCAGVLLVLACSATDKESEPRAKATYGATFAAWLEERARVESDSQGAGLAPLRTVVAQANIYDAADPVDLELAPGKDWHEGWNELIRRGGVERGVLPGHGETPKTIRATPMNPPGRVRLIDYWLRVTGWTTMFGHSLEKYDKGHRTDGVRWDTPTYWVPPMANGRSSGGNMTLMTQFGSEIPPYWQGAQPYARQTDWVFNINFQNGGIMEIYDRLHYDSTPAGAVKTAFADVVSSSYYQSLYWAPHFAYPVADPSFGFQGPARFTSNHGDSYYGYSKVEIINRYETFTVPPSRNLSKDCPAAEFKDVIALKHYQFWWDPKTRTSRGDFMVIYMARGIGWIYKLLNDSVMFDASGVVTKEGQHFLHFSPQGYVNQNPGGRWQRICPHEFRDSLSKQ